MDQKKRSLLGIFTVLHPFTFNLFEIDQAFPIQYNYYGREAYVFHDELKKLCSDHS